MSISFPYFEKARNGQQKCITCAKKIAKGAPKLTVELVDADGGQGNLHAACMPTWIAAVNWPGGLSAFAREIVANSWVDVPEAITAAAGPMLDAGDENALVGLMFGNGSSADVVALVVKHRWTTRKLSEVLEWLAQHGTLDDLRGVLEERRWSASQLDLPVHYAMYRGEEYVRLLLAAVDPRERAVAQRMALATAARNSDAPSAAAMVAELSAAPGSIDADAFDAIVSAAELAPSDRLASALAQVTPQQHAATFMFRARRRMDVTPRPRLLELLAEGIDPSITDEDGLAPIHAAALAGLASTIRALANDVARPLARDAKTYAVTFGPAEAGVGPDGKPYYEVGYQSLVLRAGWTALDIAEATLRQVEAARKAWATNPHATAESREAADGTLAAWQADLEGTLAILRELGAATGAVADDTESALRTRLLAALKAGGASQDVIDAVADVRAEGASPARLLVALLAAARGRSASASVRQTDPFWRAVLSAPPSMWGLYSTDSNFDQVHFYNSSTETEWSWDSRAKAIDVSSFPARTRKLLSDSSPILLDGDKLWVVTGVDSKKEQIAVVDLEPASLTELGGIEKFCSTTLVV